VTTEATENARVPAAMGGRTGRPNGLRRRTRTIVLGYGHRVIRGSALRFAQKLPGCCRCVRLRRTTLPGSSPWGMPSSRTRAAATTTSPPTLRAATAAHRVQRPRSPSEERNAVTLFHRAKKSRNATVPLRKYGIEESLSGGI
jgi:hypothetical protein